MMWFGRAALLILAAALPAGARGMQFEPVQLSGTELVILGRGPIVGGDAERLNRALAAVPGGQVLLALALDSGGGNVAESKLMVSIIRMRGLTVVVPRSSQCASACFLMLAASPRRVAGNDALIGVHSASENGVETDLAMAETTRMAREAAVLGVPPAVIGKMVETSPARVAWLEPQDLAAMGVTIYGDDLLSALHQPKPAAGAAAVAAHDGPPAGAAEGAADHRAWNDWLAGLQGAYRDGAVFAQSHGAEVQAAACYGPDGVNRGDFTQGCLVAQQRLAAILGKSRASAGYVQGWNEAVQTASVTPAVPASAPPPAAFVTPAAPDGVVEQEYRGVFFCASEVGQLTLRVFQQQPGGHGRRALLLFGPRDRQSMPAGSFVVDGVVDLAGGAMTLKPVTWVSQPPGYRWFGVSGSSDDGGKTFLGQITDSLSCTRFTLARALSARAGR
jgi:hypothetical protein